MAHRDRDMQELTLAMSTPDYVDGMVRNAAVGDM